MEIFTPIILGAQVLGTILWWIGIALGAERATMSSFQKRLVQIASPILLIAWFAASSLLIENGFYRATGALPALLVTLVLGFSLFFSQTFRKLLTVMPMDWSS